jgi:hypothetical protein
VEQDQLPHEPGYTSGANVQQPYPSQQNGASLIPSGAYLPTAAPLITKKSHRKLFIIIVSLALASVGTGILIIYLTRSKQQTFVNQGLTSVTKDGITFSYPRLWGALDVSGVGFSSAYGSGNTAASSSAAIYYRSSKIMATKISVSDVESSTRQAIIAEITRGIVKINTPENGCQGFNLLSQQPTSGSGYFGTEVGFSCTKNSYGASIVELDRYLYAGDGNLYEISITATTPVWQANQALFTDISRKATPI